MDEKIIEKYKKQMLEMYKIANKGEVKTVAAEVTSTAESNGRLFAVVTAVRELYPVPNAKVTLYKGDYSNMQVISSALTDQSGRTPLFTLPAPQKELSLESENTSLPYAVYNMLVEADGYVPNLHLNIPVFSGVTSIQGSNLILKETAGANMNEQIFDESQKYDL